MAKAEAQSKNPITNSVRFVEDSWDELKKVHAPTRQETFQTAVLVLIMVVFFAIFLGLTDFIVGNVMEAIFT